MAKKPYFMPGMTSSDSPGSSRVFYSSPSGRVSTDPNIFSIEQHAAQLQAAATPSVATPTAVAAIRGTEGFIEVGDKKLSTIACSEGKIEVESLIGIKSKIFVEGGYFAVQQPNGYFKIRQLTGEMLDKLKQTKKSSLEKIKIETKEGIIEVEYYSDEE